MFLIILFIAVLNSAVLPQDNKAAVSGKVTNSADKLPLLNANIIIKSSPLKEDQFTTGTITDSAGRFKLKLPYGSFIITVSYIGYKTYEHSFTLTEDLQINIELNPSIFHEEEITITGERKEPSTVKQEIEPEDLKRIPTLYNDVLRAVQILPGVSTGSELSSGYNVRGGNFDDNLIYLNGYEIYRPFLLRQGIEENKTLINPDLVEEFRFYNGSFPASYGDKMSSALEVNYKFRVTDSTSGYARLDLLNAGLTLKRKFGKLNLAAAVRYAYPGLFLNELQTNGDYKPSFKDVQFLADYHFNDSERIEVLLLFAENKFNLTPTDWKGHFGGFSRGDIRALDIFYSGDRSYSFTTGLIGIKYTSLLNKDLQLNFSTARYSTIENESSDLYSEFYYRQNAGNQNSVSEYIKSAQENVSNHLDLISYEFLPEVKLKKDNHLFTAGLNFRLTDLGSRISEYFSEDSDTLYSDFPLDRFIHVNYKLNSYSAFLQDDIKILNNIFVNAGVRATYYEFSSEYLFSPRTTVVYIPSSKHSFILSWGYYYQPPYYNELRNKIKEESEKLKAQQSIHYSAGWEYQFKEKVRMNLEVYYKDLDNLIPYYIDREKTEYLNMNSNEGYAYGFDIMFQGEIVEGMNSWLGYGYLNTKEKNKLTGKSYRRLTDQTHTLQMFLQDKIKKHPNWQAHSRLLFGSGQLYNLRQTITDSETGKKYLRVSPDKVNEFFIYFRIDMGLSANFEIGNSESLVVVAEVLNIFDHNNYGGYRFVQIAADDPNGNRIPKIFPIPQILSKRFFNVSLELRF